MKKLSDIIDNKLKAKALSLLKQAENFGDLTPLSQSEIDQFWQFDGSELERAIALQLSTRTAEETYKALVAHRAGKWRPCHKCGKSLSKCKCSIGPATIAWCLWCGFEVNYCVCKPKT